MVSTLASRSTRLALLLRGFGLCPTQVAREEHKATITNLKSAYKRLAKEKHPDRVPADEQIMANQVFSDLQTDFEETVSLLQTGVRPAQNLDAYSQRWSPSWSGDLKSATRVHWTPQPAEEFKHREPPEFDIFTRVKGTLVFCTSLYFFLSGFREFLVWSAGSTYAWSRPPVDLNPFWVRRYRDDWVSHQVQVVEAQKSVPRNEKVEAIQQKKSRDVPSFYQRRGISNVRKKTQPRGFGESL